jgi:hypothetical protein
MDFARRASAAQPDLDPQLRRITGLYLQLRYEPAPTAGTLLALRRELQAFRP